MPDTSLHPTREPCVPGQKVIDPAQWTGTELQQSTDWIYQLTEAEITDIDNAIRGVEAAGLDIMEITQDTFPLPAFGPALVRIRKQLLNGLGLTLIRGFPH